MSESLRRGAVVALVAVVGALLGTAPVGATDARPGPSPTVLPTAGDDSTAGRAVRAVQAALDHVGSTDDGVAHDDVFGAEVGRLSVPTRGRVATGDGQHPLTISLPLASTTARERRRAGGAVPDDDMAAQTDVVTRPVGTAGVQMFTVIHGPLAPDRFRYDLDLAPGTSLVPRPDGGVSVVDPSGAAVGSLAPPWAVAADGRRVSTTYRVSGSVLTQLVDHRAGTAYPVVADPAYQRNCGIVTCTWYLSVAKTKELAKQLGVLAVNVAINLNVGAACAVAGVAGGPVAGVLCTVITAVGVAHAQSVFGAAARSGDCVRLATGARAPLGRVAQSNRYCSRK